MIFTSWITPFVKEEKTGNTDDKHSLSSVHDVSQVLSEYKKIDQLTLLTRKITEEGQNITTPPIFLCVWILILINHRNNTALSFAITKYKLLKCLKMGWDWCKTSEIIFIIQAYDTLFHKTKRKRNDTLQWFSQIRLWNQTLWKKKYIVQEVRIYTSVVRFSLADQLCISTGGSRNCAIS